MRTGPAVRERLSSAQERFEATVVGEITISVVVSLIVLTAVVWASPDSEIKRTAVPRLAPLAVTSGLDQAWSMFAPDPYRRLETVEVHVSTARGDERVWTFPTGGVLEQSTWYRWHKLKEQAVRMPEIRADIARWAADRLLDEADYPADVSMVLTTEDFPPPGSATTSTAPPVTEVLYTETLVAPS